jgi:hypothetical protein
MSLLPREQHELRQIEDGIAGRDPALALWLSGRVRSRRPRRVIAVVYLLAPVLIVLGGVLGVGTLLVVGVIVAVVTPLAAKSLVFPRRVEPPGRYDVLDDL